MADQLGERHFQFWSVWLPWFIAVWIAGYFGLTHGPIALFEQNWIYIPIGFCGATLGNISAVGGGIIFTPVIMYFFPLPPVTAPTIALASES